MAGTSSVDIAANRRALEQAAVNLSVVLKAAGLGAEAALARVGVELTSQIRQTLSQPGSGVVYKRGSGSHRASAPGEPPAVDTGRLRASYDWRTGRDPRPYVEVGSSVVYAPFLEFGTSRMQARPHFRPSIDAYRGKVTERIAQAMEREERGVIARLRSGISSIISVFGG